jgi:hypothetical protein
MTDLFYIPIELEVAGFILQVPQHHTQSAGSWLPGPCSTIMHDGSQREQYIMSMKRSTVSAVNHAKHCRSLYLASTQARADATSTAGHARACSSPAHLQTRELWQRVWRRHQHEEGAHRLQQRWQRQRWVCHQRALLPGAALRRVQPDALRHLRQRAPGGGGAGAQLSARGGRRDHISVSTTYPQGLHDTVP